MKKRPSSICRRSQPIEHPALALRRRRFVRLRRCFGRCSSLRRGVEVGGEGLGLRAWRGARRRRIDRSEIGGRRELSFWKRIEERDVLLMTRTCILTCQALFLSGEQAGCLLNRCLANENSMPTLVKPHEDSSISTRAWAFGRPTSDPHPDLPPVQQFSQPKGKHFARERKIECSSVPKPGRSTVLGIERSSHLRTCPSCSSSVESQATGRLQQQDTS